MFSVQKPASRHNSFSISDREALATWLTLSPVWRHDKDIEGCDAGEQVRLFHTGDKNNERAYVFTAEDDEVCLEETRLVRASNFVTTGYVRVGNFPTLAAALARMADVPMVLVPGGLIPAQNGGQAAAT